MRIISHHGWVPYSEREMDESRVTVHENADANYIMTSPIFLSMTMATETQRSGFTNPTAEPQRRRAKCYFML